MALSVVLGAIWEDSLIMIGLTASGTVVKRWDGGRTRAEIIQRNNKERTPTSRYPSTRTPSGIETSPKQSTSGIKEERKGTKPLMPAKSSLSKNGGWKKATLTGATKGILRKAGVDPKLIDRYDTDDEGGYSPKGKGKYPKAKKTEAEKLQEGWEGWDSPTRKTLGYDTDDDDTD